MGSARYKVRCLLTFSKHRAQNFQIFNEVDVKLHYIFLELKHLKETLGNLL